MKCRKILVIDDEEDVLAYLTAVLASNGYEPYSVSDIGKAMEKVGEIRPDLICLDIMMPKETGISFYAKLRKDEEFSKIPVIVVSGVVETDKFNIRSYIPDESVPSPECYMEKPIDVTAFVRKIKTLIK